MARNKRMPTLWEIPDDMWELIEPIIKADDPEKHTGRHKVDRRRVLDGIIFHLRTGCQWNSTPKVYGDDSTIHRYFQRWCEHGIMEKIWAILVEKCEALGEVDWKWQAADTALNKARLGGTQSARIRRIGQKMVQNAVSW